MKAISSAPLSILWRQVWGLAVMLAAILFSFMIYGIYQPKILGNLGFLQLVASLGIVQGLLGTIVEPLVGGFSDFILVRAGSRLPQITVGVTIAGLIFVAIAFLLPIHAPTTIRWLFLLLMIVWLMAMIAIRGPIVALLYQLAPAKQLPIANEVIGLVIGLVGAVGPFLADILKSLGASVSFMIGAISLMLGAIALYNTVPRHAIPVPSVVASASLGDYWQARLTLGLTAVVGIGTGMEINLLLATVPATLHSSLTNLSPAAITSIVLLISALMANPLGRLTQHWGVIKAMQIGLGATAALMGIVCFKLTGLVAMGLLLGCSFAFGLVFMSMVPFALSYVALNQAGLSTGLFFGGSGFGSTIFQLLAQFLGKFTSITAFATAAIAFILTALCLHYFDIRHQRDRLDANVPQ